MDVQLLLLGGPLDEGKLAEGPEALVAQLPRAPGQKEARWTHLAGGPVESGAVTAPGLHAERPDPFESRVALLEEEMAALSRKISDLKKRLGES